MGEGAGQTPACFPYPTAIELRSSEERTPDKGKQNSERALPGFHTILDIGLSKGISPWFSFHLIYWSGRGSSALSLDLEISIFLRCNEVGSWSKHGFCLWYL